MKKVKNEIAEIAKERQWKVLPDSADHMNRVSFEAVINSRMHTVVVGQCKETGYWQCGCIRGSSSSMFWEGGKVKDSQGRRLRGPSKCDHALKVAEAEAQKKLVTSLEGVARQMRNAEEALAAAKMQTSYLKRKAIS